MWCATHPTYSAKREPSGLCKRCWQLYFYKNPEAKDVLMRTYREAEEIMPTVISPGWSVPK